MKRFKFLIKIGVAIASIVLSVTPATPQSGNQSNISGPEPGEMVVPEGNQSDITGPELPDFLLETEDETQQKEEPPQEEESQQTNPPDREVDRPLYESQLQQANVDTAVQLIEEYQAVEFSDYLGLNLFGDVPSLQEISLILYSLWQYTGQKSAFIYISSQSNQLELVMVLPEPPDPLTGGNPNLFLTARERGVRHIVPVSRETLIETIQIFRNELLDPRKRRSKSYLSAAQQIYQWTIAPLDATLQENEIDILVFSMDSGLRSLPIAALHDEQEFLIEKYALALVPSFGLTDISYVDVRSPPILAMGASKFSELPPLPAVPIELQTIMSHVWQGEYFLNELFTVKNFFLQNLYDNFGAIHIATHAQFLPGDISNSFIQFFDRKLTLNEFAQMARELGWNSQDNPPIELLVLSACRTALGDPSAELGFAGLAVISGVKTALASLWYVSDAGTLGLMSEFYRQLSQNPIKSQALRRSQIAMIKGEVRVENGMLWLTNGEAIALPPAIARKGNLDLSHPYFWSAFITIGNWN